MSEVRSELLAKYNKLLPGFRSTENVVRTSLSSILDSEQINYSIIESRVKEFDSFRDKVDRKGYSDPFEENEDFIGVRVVLYFPDDVPTVCDLIEREFQVDERTTKERNLSVDQFGYRSTHLIGSLPKAWCKAPAYRGLEGIKVEFQVRTILMHAWAAIEHHLQYKSKSDVPSEIQRKFYLLSAKFEDADDQLQLINDRIFEYSGKIKDVVSSNEDDELSHIEINVSSLKSFLESELPDRRASDSDNAYSALVSELLAVNVKNLAEIKALLNNEKLQKVFENYESPDRILGGSYNNVGVIRVMMKISSDEFYEKTKNLSSGSSIGKARQEYIEKARQEYKDALIE